jgi:hypothetical protein
MRSLREVHIGLVVSVHPSVCSHNSTREPLDGFGWNLVWRLCHWERSIHTHQWRVSTVRSVSDIKISSNVVWIEPFTHIRRSGVRMPSVSVQCCPTSLATIFDCTSLTLTSLNWYGTVCVTSLQSSVSLYFLHSRGKLRTYEFQDEWWEIDRARTITCWTVWFVALKICGYYI